MLNLIITADDYGMSKSINDAILEGIQCGRITSTNVMVNMPYYKDIVKVKQLFPNVSIGIHLNLTCGKPVSNIEEIKSLVDHYGTFFSATIFRRKVIRGEIKRSEIKKEIYAQYQKFAEMGFLPDYWNTHQHIHMVYGLLFLINKISIKHGVAKVRCNSKFYIGLPSINTIELLKNALIRIEYQLLGKKTLHPKGLVRFRRGYSIYDLNLLTDYSKQHEKKKCSVELMIHPAISIDSEYFGNLQEERVKEYVFITDKKNKFFQNNHQIKLISFNVVN